MGDANNLVFTSDYLDLIEQKLEAFVCLYCEKTFKNREVLKEHMRKKGHKTINPRAREFDRFYLVNYREFGRAWKGGRFSLDYDDEEEEEDDDEMPNGFNYDDYDSCDSSRWEDWVGDPSKPVCLFCPVAETDLTQLNTHMTSVHDFDLVDIRNRLKLDFYRQVKLVNYIRRRVSLGECMYCREVCGDFESVVAHMTEKEHFRVPDDWDSPSSLETDLLWFNTYENDFLLHHIEDTNETMTAVPVTIPEDPREEELCVLEYLQKRIAEVRVGI